MAIGKYGTNKTYTVGVKLDPQLYKRYTEYAKENGYRFGGLALKIIKDYFAKIDQTNERQPY